MYPQDISIIEIGITDGLLDPFDFSDYFQSNATRLAMREIIAMDSRPVLGESKNPMASTGFRRRDHMNRK